MFETITIEPVMNAHEASVERTVAATMPGFFAPTQNIRQGSPLPLHLLNCDRTGAETRVVPLTPTIIHVPADNH